MALIIEDGSIVANANSYVNLATARAYATARGADLPTDDTAAEILLIKAMDYLESKRAEYQGRKTSTTQSLQWPRYGVRIDGISFSSSAIPSELTSAQIQLSMEANTGTDLMPTRSSGFITKDVTGPLETEYSEKVGISITPRISAVDALLQPLFNVPGRGAALRSLRV